MMNETLKNTALAAMIASLSSPSAFSAEPLSRAAQQGYDQGFHDCARAIDKYIKFIHSDDNTYAYLGVWGTTSPNEQVFSTTTTQANKDANIVSTFTGSKNPSGKCDITLTEVVFSQSPCLKLRDSVFKDWKYYDDLGGSSVLEDPTDTLDNIILTSTANNMCVVVKHFVATNVAP